MGSSAYLGGSTIINTGNSGYCRSDWLDKSNVKNMKGGRKKRKEKRKEKLREIGRINALRRELLQEISRERGKWDVKYLTNDQKIALHNEIIQKGGLIKWAESHRKQQYASRTIKKTSNKKINTRKKITLPAFKSALTYELQQALSNKNNNQSRC